MKEPTFQGKAGRAWRLETHAQPANLESYLVHRPGSHPFWCCYLFAVVHLRDDGVSDPAKKKFPEATHELQILSINPEYMKTPQPGVPIGELRLLTPPDLVYQFQGTDDEAERLLTDFVKVIVARLDVSPDVDFRPYWERTLAKTLEHYRTGGHSTA